MQLHDFAAFCKEKGFVFANSEIYGGLSGQFDYGFKGIQLKKNIVDSYWKHFVLKNENIIGQDGSIISHPTVWSASGHVQNFADPIITTKNHKARADHFVEEKLGIRTEGMNTDQLFSLIKEHKLQYEGENILSVEKKNLMLTTVVGTDTLTYLRPETCQAIFCNAKLLSKIERLSLPFGIVQVGKAFRNEISPRNFIFRCREFEQMEMEYFFDPFSRCQKNVDLDLKLNVLLSDETETKEISIGEISSKVNSHHLYWIYSFYIWLTRILGIKSTNLRLREHHKDELSHYSSATFDIDYKYPFTSEFKELCGIANRGSYDLNQHAQFSKKNLLMKNKDGENIFPHVIEPSIGLDRLFMALLCDAYEFDKERDYIVLHLSPKLSPTKYGVFPLFSKNHKKEEHIKKAREMFEKIIDDGYSAFYDQAGSIGKRYARQDEVGTPFCITVDDLTLIDNTVTIRFRDTKVQERISIEKLYLF